MNTRIQQTYRLRDATFDVQGTRYTDLEIGIEIQNAPGGAAVGEGGP